MGEEGWWVCQILTEMLQQAEAALRQQEGPVESHALGLVKPNPHPQALSIKAAMLVQALLVMRGEQEEVEASTGEEEAQIRK